MCGVQLDDAKSQSAMPMDKSSVLGHPRDVLLCFVMRAQGQAHISGSERRGPDRA